MADDVGLNALRADDREAPGGVGADADVAESDGTTAFTEFVTGLTTGARRTVAELAARTDSAGLGLVRHAAPTSQAADSTSAPLGKPTAGPGENAGREGTSSERSLSKTIDDAQHALEPLAALPPKPPGWDSVEVSPAAHIAREHEALPSSPPLVVHTGARAAPPAPGAAATADPVFAALATVRSLLTLVPDGPEGHTRLSECMAAVRQTGEDNLFPGTPGVRMGADSVAPSDDPRRELNAFVESTRTLMLSLLGSVSMEHVAARRLEGELRRQGDFLEPDDRGTLMGYIEPTGPNLEKQRNDARLDALAACLHALRQNPHVVVTHALDALRRVAIPPALLSADPRRGVVTFQAREYSVSHEACHFVRLLIEAGGGYVSMTNVRASAGSTTKPVASRLRAKLPPGLVALIKSGKKGSRLLTDRLSHV